jgi:hypothetical protein
MVIVGQYLLERGSQIIVQGFLMGRMHLGVIYGLLLVIVTHQSCIHTMENHGLRQVEGFQVEVWM